MKLIHTADIHLGAKADSRYPKEVAERIRSELRLSLHRLVAYAAGNDVSAVLLAGDVFDSDHPFQKDRNFFYQLVKSNPSITFFYLRGNHDADGVMEDVPENLKTFSDTLRTYDLGEITVSGAELTAQNADALPLSLSLSPEKKNILMLHGSKDEVRFPALRRKNIDYLALGHIHKPEWGALDDRGRYGYCGCLQGRGFDEIGERGFILLDTEKGLEPVFVPFAELRIEEFEVDVTGAAGGYEVSRKIAAAVPFDKNRIYRVVLTGEAGGDDTDLAGDASEYLKHECLFLQIRDGTERVFDVSRYEAERSLFGEFARRVATSGFSENDKAKILSIGRRALAGKEIE